MEKTQINKSKKGVSSYTDGFMRDMPIYMFIIPMKCDEKRRFMFESIEKYSKNSKSLSV